MTYYIDPGASKGCAVACFTHPHHRAHDPTGGLIGLGIWTERDGFAEGRYWGASYSGPAVWEMPQVYPSARREDPKKMIAKANDLIRISAAGSACASVLGWGRGGVRSVLPREWKKQISKPAHHARVIACLTQTEIDLVVEAYAMTSRSAGTTLAHLTQYIRAGMLWVAKNPGKELKGYGATITDLLDAIALGLSQEGRLVI